MFETITNLNRIKNDLNFNWVRNIKLRLWEEILTWNDGDTNKMVINNFNLNKNITH
jgi:hypothetical protein